MSGGAKNFQNNPIPTPVPPSMMGTMGSKLGDSVMRGEISRSQALKDKLVELGIPSVPQKALVDARYTSSASDLNDRVIRADLIYDLEMNLYNKDPDGWREDKIKEKLYEPELFDRLLHNKFEEERDRKREHYESQSKLPENAPKELSVVLEKIKSDLGQAEAKLWYGFSTPDGMLSRREYELLGNPNEITFDQDVVIKSVSELLSKKGLKESDDFSLPISDIVTEADKRLRELDENKSGKLEYLETLNEWQKSDYKYLMSPTELPVPQANKNSVELK